MLINVRMTAPQKNKWTCGLELILKFPFTKVPLHICTHTEIHKTLEHV